MLPKKLFKVDWVEERDGSDVKTQLSDVEKPVLFFKFCSNCQESSKVRNDLSIFEKIEVALRLDGVSICKHLWICKFL